jgi:transposase
LLEEIYAPTAPPLLRDVPAVELLRQIWIQSYYYEEGQVRWREPENIPAATQFINSPYDPEAHLGKKRSTMWTGYKIHLSETCDENLPHLITHVATTPAPRTDEAMTESIHTGLQQADVLPSVHLMDSGYVTSQTLVSSQRRFGVEVIGPTPVDLQWQANTEGGIDVSQFHIDWDHQQVTCPQGRASRSWAPFFDSRHHELIKIQFSVKDCGGCPSRPRCIRSEEKYPRRTLTLRPRDQHEALQAARRRQQTPAFAQQYALREGIEATISQGVRAFGMRHSRYIGEAKTHLQHIGIAVAINLVRVVAWLDGEPLAPTRVSAYERLYYAA